MPTWNEVVTVAKETYYEKEVDYSKDVVFADLSCNDAVNYLIKHLAKPGSFFYLILNGWFLGQLGDYASC